MDFQDYLQLWFPMIYPFTHQILTEQLLYAKTSVKAGIIGTKARDFALKEL